MGKSLMNLYEEMENSLDVLLKKTYLSDYKPDSFDTKYSFLLRWEIRGHEIKRHVCRVSAFKQMDVFHIEKTIINDVIEVLGKLLSEFHNIPPNNVFFVLDEIYLQHKMGDSKNSTSLFHHLPLAVKNLIVNEEIPFEQIIKGYKFDYVLPEHMVQYHEDFENEITSETEKIKLLCEMLLDEKKLPTGEEFDLGKYHLIVNSMEDFYKHKSSSGVAHPIFHFIIYIFTRNHLEPSIIESINKYLEDYISGETNHKVEIQLRIN